MSGGGETWTSRLSGVSLLHTWRAHALRYDDALQQAAALDAIAPFLERIKEIEEAQQQQQQQVSEAPLAPRDAFVKALLRWFKDEFFTWHNEAICPTCGPEAGEKTRLVRVEEPTQSERADGEPGRVEVYNCPCCSAEVRFPRLNDPVRLLQPDWRKGRCGEWANAFCLCLRALGYRQVRYVLDTTDHVWCEYWSSSLNRWVHVDACEASWDEPHLYSEGWGKKLRHVIAFSMDGVVDVTRRYVKGQQKYTEALQRRAADVSERNLAASLAYATTRVRLTTTAGAEAAASLARGAAADLIELLALHDGACDDCGHGALQGRTSGSLAWRLSRGEMKR